jgi:drug/metabolite transporter (DMT)-like permease
MVKAMAWMVFSGLSFALMGAMVKFSGDLPLPAKVFFRNLVTLGIATTVGFRQGENLLSRTPHWRGLLVRSLSGLTGVFLYFLRHRPHEPGRCVAAEQDLALLRHGPGGPLSG